MHYFKNLHSGLFISPCKYHTVADIKVLCFTIPSIHSKVLFLSLEVVKLLIDLNTYSCKWCDYYNFALLWKCEWRTYIVRAFRYIHTYMCLYKSYILRTSQAKWIMLTHSDHQIYIILKRCEVLSNHFDALRSVLTLADPLWNIALWQRVISIDLFRSQSCSLYGLCTKPVQVKKL